MMFAERQQILRISQSLQKYRPLGKANIITTTNSLHNLCCLGRHWRNQREYFTNILLSTHWPIVCIYRANRKQTQEEILRINTTVFTHTHTQGQRHKTQAAAKPSTAYIHSGWWLWCNNGAKGQSEWAPGGHISGWEMANQGPSLQHKKMSDT